MQSRLQFVWKEAAFVFAQNSCIVSRSAEHTQPPLELISIKLGAPPTGGTDLLLGVHTGLIGRATFPPHCLKEYDQVFEFWYTNVLR